VAPVLALGVPDIDIVLKASLGYGNALSMQISSPVRRTVPLVPPPGVLAAGGNTGFLNIPLWAMGFTILDGGSGVGAVTVPDYTILLSEDAVNISAMYKLESRTNLSNQVEGQFPIPGNARFIKVINNLATNTQHLKALYNLGF
jgi:hypothetical protein